jgi:hypothetical protein
MENQFSNIIFRELNVKESLQEIDKKINNIQQIKNDFADKASKIKPFFKENGLNYNYYKDLIGEAEKTLLIDCYTLAEQIYKEFIYLAIDYDNHSDTTKYYERVDL